MLEEKKEAGRLEVKLASDEEKERPVSLSMTLDSSTTAHLPRMLFEMLLYSHDEENPTHYLSARPRNGTK